MEKKKIHGYLTGKGSGKPKPYFSESGYKAKRRGPLLFLKVRKQRISSK